MTVIELLNKLQEIAEAGHGDSRVHCLTADAADFGQVVTVDDAGYRDAGGTPYIDLITDIDAYEVIKQ